MTDFLLELLSEEIPARMQAKACDDLARLFAAELAKANVAAAALETYATPRRLALIARALPDATAALAEEIKGPRAGAPPQALDGFLRKTGLAREDLIERDGVLFGRLRRPGRPLPELLAEAVAAVVAGFPWPKSMRWGAASASTASPRWVRPLRRIVALFGDEVVPVEIGDVTSGAATVGHRLHHPGVITIGSAADYADKLRLCHVVLDARERQAIVREGATRAAAEAGLALVPDEGLVVENAGLTEWPVPLLGHFDPAFLEVPREVIQLTMRANQKYFACAGPDGALAPAFVCTANLDAADGGAAIIAGNAKVLAARLADARFFWEQDLKVSLAEQARKLDRIVFHEKLGTVADKAARVAKLARWLVEEGIVTGRKALSPAGSGEDRSAGGTSQPRSWLGERREAEPSASPSAGDSPHPDPLSDGEREKLSALAEQAALLCKADLVTGMVGEFPELQGIMGGYYARAEGLPDEVADAIRDHYKPVGQGDEVPTAPVTVAVAVADKLDTLTQFFRAEMPPTGSKDPFALRRAALGVIELVDRNMLRLPLREAILTGAAHAVADQNLPYAQAAILLEKNARAGATLLAFFADRLKVQQREAGVRHDLIDAVFALGGEDDLVRLLARVHALQAFIATDDGASLLAGYKRAANILRIEEKRDGAGFAPVDALAYVPLPEEARLLDALGAAEQAASAAVAAEAFAAAMQALAALRPAIDAFFDAVTVNDPDPAKRAARLGLLVRIRDAVHRVADFSRIEG